MFETFKSAVRAVREHSHDGHAWQLYAVPTPDGLEFGACVGAPTEGIPWNTRRARQFVVWLQADGRAPIHQPTDQIMLEGAYAIACGDLTPQTEGAAQHD